VSPYTGVSTFLPSSRRIAQFAEGSHDPSPTDKIVYVDGAFDVFHPGHIALLKKAKELGTYLIVGVFSDDIVSHHKGGNGVWPIMNMYERALGALSCRYVDEVLLNAPWQLSEDIIRNHKISVVVAGNGEDEYGKVTAADWEAHYAAAKKLNAFHSVESGSKLTTTQVVHRIVANRQQYEERNRKKEAKELSEMTATKTN
jgi:ethanolamine-phosphate cytidylyltransferase